jgi:hypothetical protein
MDLTDDSFASERPRWSQRASVQPVRFEDEERSVARGVRLCGPAARVGDPVLVIDQGIRVEGVITEVHSTLRVRRVP